MNFNVAIFASVRFWALLLLATLPATARADATPDSPTGSETLSQLLEACAAPASSPQAQYCSGYVMGVADAMSDRSLTGNAVCAPRGVMQVQLVEAVRNWSALHPDALEAPAADAVAHAFADWFPCR
jgi:hypothetical protein